MKNYLFKSARLGFRNWLSSDLEALAAINADKEVMKFFPSTRNLQETWVFIERMQKQFDKKGYCYFAVDILETNELIGFIGLSEQNYDADFTPCIDIGWRLAKAAWNNGYATEGARRCLEFGFETLQLDKIYSIAPVVNTKSQQVMKKIGMRQVKTFDHPQLLDNDRLRKCLLYELKKM
ncbi:MAG: N-acetyltransferase [Bacteroidetes bacterium]|nr:MAG: N-acetyltransferase [Bacteroidota bacterium]